MQSIDQYVSAYAQGIRLTCSKSESLRVPAEFETIKTLAAPKASSSSCQAGCRRVTSSSSCGRVCIVPIYQFLTVVEDEGSRSAHDAIVLVQHDASDTT